MKIDGCNRRDMEASFIVATCIRNSREEKLGFSPGVSAVSILDTRSGL